LSAISRCSAILFKHADHGDAKQSVIFITASVLEPSKMKYENVISKEQINRLELTSAKSSARNYPRPAEEAALQDQIGVVRQNKQDAAAIDSLTSKSMRRTGFLRRNNPFLDSSECRRSIDRWHFFCPGFWSAEWNSVGLAHAPRSHLACDAISLPSALTPPDHGTRLCQRVRLLGRT